MKGVQFITFSEVCFLFTMLCQCVIIRVIYNNMLCKHTCIYEIGCSLITVLSLCH